MNREPPSEERAANKKTRGSRAFFADLTA